MAAACLAHDIGNPPFGHSGEDAISAYFGSRPAERFITNLTDAERADLLNFEGNAAGFRILTHTYAAHNTGSAGLGLTYATLGAFTKYPKPSVVAERAKTGGASEKKYGHFQTENAQFRVVAEELGLQAKDAAAGFYHRSRKLLDLLPDQYRAVGPQAGAPAYEQILLLTDYVAGMTDQNALSLYKTIKGIELPKGF